MQITTRPNACEHFTDYVIDALPNPVFKAVDDRVRREAFDNIERYSGFMQRFCESFIDDQIAATPICDDNVHVTVDRETCTVVVSLANIPQGDDVYDGDHEHWTAPHPQQWVEAIAPLRALGLTITNN